MKYEKKFNFEFPLFLKRALELSGFSDEIAFRNFDSSLLPELYEELTGQIIRFANSFKMEPNDINKEAYTHIRQKSYSSLSDYKLPVQFKSILSQMITESTKNQQQSSYTAQCSTAKRPRPEKDNNLVSESSIDQLQSLPSFLQIVINNALVNKQGFKGNRYSDMIKDIAGLILCRCGPKQYKMLQINMSLPEISVVRDYIVNQGIQLHEGVLYINELRSFLDRNNYPLEVGIFEDGTKVDL